MAQKMASQDMKIVEIAARSESSVMKTLRTYNLICSSMLPYLLKDSDGWLTGTKRRDLKVTSPSAIK